MSRKSKSKSINRALKWNQWYIKNTVSDKFVALLCYLLQYKLFFYVLRLIYLFSSHFIYATENPTLEDHLDKSTHNVPTPIYPQKIQVPLSEGKRLSPQHLSKLVNKNTMLNLNIAYYFLNILAYPDVSTWSTTGGPIKRTIKHLGLNRHH